MTATPPRRTLVVREATRADLLEVFRIERTSFPQPWPYGAFEGFLGTPGFLVAECRDEGDDDPGTIAGYIVADTVPNHGSPIGHVKDIAVHPDHRGQGIGRRLLERGLAVMDSRGAARVKLEVRDGNEAALSLYRDLGFTHHHTVPGYYDDGTDALVMVRPGS
ncbi:GNAT family N-acetyltransferase [Haloglomus halophilum]|uniref:GNAT family N-acetyltransferase n=1 Tax=Haloglomus halophilum TaxID=2962672 RepID=UPI0020C9D9EE|nr:N-acetyltransferase [Haloglomus halophilum]